MTPRFIHLRVHTEYSLSDGITEIPSLIECAVKYRMPALAMTDQSNLFGTIKFYQEAIQAGIKPIIGADIWLQEEKFFFRITALCQNEVGYKNLLLLISKSFLESKTEKAAIQRDWLKEHGEGLLILSGAMEGDVGRSVFSDNAERVKKIIHFWKAIFPERYYLELRRTGRKQEEDYNQKILVLAEQYTLPVVATNDVRFLEQDDFEAHEARVCIHDGFVLADSRRSKQYSDQQYFRSQEDMIELFSDIPEALENTVEISKRCNVTLQLGKSFLPRFPVPSGDTVENHLIETAKKGLEERLAISFDTTAPLFPSQRKSYDLRLDAELTVINKMGFAGYFLIVADFTRWARNNNVPVGPGRGSGPGSLVAYSLKITDLDPLAHDLLFERFLNPERVSMPDFDIDFCMEGRDRVIDYVMQTHGRDSVAQIITYGKMAARAVVRDVGRVLGMSYGFVDKLAKLIPFEIGMTLGKALEAEDILRERYEKEDDVRTLIDLAKKLEGITRNVGKHAGGVVIAPRKLIELTPLYCEQNQSEHVVTQFDKDDVEAVGLVKFDFLGLRTLTIIHRAVEQINRLRQIKEEALLDIHLIPINDTDTFSLLKACKTTAVFQLESRGMKDLVKRLQPDCFEDIVALVALFRPGPLQSGMVDDFINRKHGRATVSFLHPSLEPILRSTYGVILYQEQVMQIAQVLAGYSLGSADLLRRAMGKKKPEEMAKQREIFCNGAVSRGVDMHTATHIFDLMEKFAGYGFNKSHSASYALIAYQTGWLKAHYTAAYMAAVLSADMDHTEKVVLFIDDCQLLGLQILPPDINQSDYAFRVLNETQIRYGLGAIKGMGSAAIESILEARAREKQFNNLFHFCTCVDLRKVNRRVIEALIKSGAMDGISEGIHRATLFASIDQALRHAEKMRNDELHRQQNLFGELETLTQDVHYVSVSEWREHDRLFNEKETLGLYLTGHPIHRYKKELAHFVTCFLQDARPEGNKTITLAGIITQIRLIQTKRGDRMAVLTIEDNASRMDVVCFPEVYKQYHGMIEKDQLIIVEGEMGLDEFTQRFRILSRHIYTMMEARERHAKYLRIGLSTLPDSELENLANVLKPYRGGTCRVTLDYTNQEAKANLLLDETWRVRPTEELLDALRHQFSGNNVEMVY